MWKLYIDDITEQLRRAKVQERSTSSEATANFDYPDGPSAHGLEFASPKRRKLNDELPQTVFPPLLLGLS